MDALPTVNSQVRAKTMYQVDNPPGFVTILQHPDDCDPDEKDKTKSTVTPNPTDEEEEELLTIFAQMNKDVGVTVAATATAGSDPISDVTSSTSAAAAVGSVHKTDVKNSTTSPTETVKSDSTSDVKISPTGGVADGAYYDGPGDTVVRMSKEFYSKLLLWSYAILRKWCDEIITFDEDDHLDQQRTPTRWEKWDAVIALSFVSGTNSIFWINQQWEGEISWEIVRYFESLDEKS